MSYTYEKAMSEGGFLVRTYSIYKIKEEHLTFIFGRERKLLEMMQREILKRACIYM